MSKRKRGKTAPKAIIPTVTPPVVNQRPNGGRREPKQTNRQEAA